MATDAAHDGYYVAFGEAHSRSVSASPDSHGYYGQEDKRLSREGRNGGSQYPSWPGQGNYPGYPSNEAKSYGPSYCLPVGVSPMPMPIPPLGFGGHAGHIVPPQPPMFGIPTGRTVRTRAEGTDSSSSNCTPRDHYTATDKHSPVKRHGRKDAGPRFPVVKIPEALKKQGGQPSPATWVNSRGFPLRMGKPDCKHYISKGWCAYGSLCKFNHPDNMQTTPMPYPMMPMCPGSQPMVMNAPWMGLPYQWNGPWNQHGSPVHYPYMCHPNSAGPSSSDSGNSPSSQEHERAIDQESIAMYH